MARRSDHTASELSLMIIDTAEKIIDETGSNSLSVRKIMNRIGYTPGTLYQHFSGISEVQVEVNGRTLARLEAYLRGHDQPKSPSERLHAFAGAYLHFIQQNETMWNALFDYRRDPKGALPGWYAERIQSLMEMISTCFRDAGANPKTSPLRAAQLIWASVHSVCSLEASGKLPLIMGRSLEVLVYDLVETHLTAYLQNMDKGNEGAGSGVIASP